MHTSNRTNPFINRKPLAGGGRETFLSRVRQGLGHDPHISPTPPEIPTRDESLIRQVALNDPTRIDRFIRKAKENTMVVQRVSADASAVCGAIDTCFANHKIAKSVINARALNEQFQISAHLQKTGMIGVSWGLSGCREGAFDCQASITDCRAGLADTGAILVWSDPTFGRTTTLVVPVHVVLLPVSRILPDLIDGLDLVRRENNGAMPSNVVVINGPSKTGDIEMKLVTGVHGPKFMYIILIDEI